MGFKPEFLENRSTITPVSVAIDSHIRNIKNLIVEEIGFDYGKRFNSFFENNHLEMKHKL
jgi:hypothetical protein